MTTKPSSSTPVRETIERADDAFAVHRALILAETRDPSLRDNPQWILHRMDAFETYHRALTGDAA
jgi:hypothetical protein